MAAMLRLLCVAAAATAAAAPSPITHFVFISHPLLYEGMPAATIAETNAGIYQVWERGVKATSLASIGALGPGSFVVQLNGGSDEFIAAATAKLGASHVLKLGAAAGVSALGRGARLQSGCGGAAGPRQSCCPLDA